MFLSRCNSRNSAVFFQVNLLLGMNGVTLGERIICLKFVTLHWLCIMLISTYQPVRDLKIFQQMIT